ncbi:MAG: response regulator transcription factor [Bryobacterales bacterium]|nr:response regulator transcription factor [Bryobacterales bacterium]
MKPIPVFAFDAQPIVIEGLKAAFQACEDLRLAGFTCEIRNVAEQVAALGPAVVLIDASPGTGAIHDLLQHLRIAAPESQCVLWVTQWSEAESFRALQGGARGVLKKALPVSDLFDCVRAVGRGGIWIETSSAADPAALPGEETQSRLAPRLTAREREIMELICRGMKNKEIGAALKIATGTVKVHLMHIFEKTGARDRFDLAISAHKMGQPLGPGKLSLVHPDIANLGTGIM